MIVRSLKVGGVAITVGDPPHPSVRTYRMYTLGGTAHIPDDEADLFRSRIDFAVEAGLIEIVKDTAQARLDSGAATGLLAFCSVDDEVGDLVYVSASNTVARALASLAATSDVVGYILSKEAPNSCRITKDPGPVASSGLTVGNRVFLSAVIPGKVTSTPPSDPNILVEVGIAMSSISFFFTGAKTVL